jgi:hypothetical protein
MGSVSFSKTQVPHSFFLVDQQFELIYQPQSFYLEAATTYPQALDMDHVAFIHGR